MRDKGKVAFNKLKKARKIHEGQVVRVTCMNHIVEILSLAIEPNALMKIRKLDKYRYVDLETGEIHEYNVSENRGDNIAGLKETFRKLRHLINNNFIGAANELFITLSYAENVTDTKRLYQDFDVFMKRFKRKYHDIDYLSIVEPQGRGAWHCHVLVRFNSLNKVYVSNNDIIAPMWSHGFTKTKSLRDVDNIGAYLNAYLSDVEVCDENVETIFGAIQHRESAFDSIVNEFGEIVVVKRHEKISLEVVEREIDTDGKKIKKQFVKGARLHMYPSGMNLYRCSRGIKKPETEKMEYEEVKKIVGSTSPNYSRTIDILQEEKVINSITYEQYNLKRKEGKGSRNIL